MASVLALDLGSTQLKLMVMDENARVVYLGTQGYPTQAPRAAYLEQRPQDWELALARGMEELSQQYAVDEIVAISFSGHMSGVVGLDVQGEPTSPCIMLSDSRSEEECLLLEKQIGSAVRERTGNPIINAFSLPKLLWLKRMQPDVWKRTCHWVSPKDYLRFLLTAEIATEYTDAYNSLCIDYQTRDWCDDIIKEAGLEKEKFPPVLTPDGLAGHVTQEAARRFHLKAGTPVYAGGADMACGALGMGLFEEGDSALTLGTCATFLAPVSDVNGSHFGEVTFHLHAVPGLMYALGSHINGGLAVNWLTKVLSEQAELDFDLIHQLSEGAKELPTGCGGLITLPYLAGSGSPYFSAVDRQTILGLNPSVTRPQLFKSELEGVTLNLAQTKQAFDDMVPGGLRRVLLGGGGSKIGIWPQMIADVFGIAIDITANADASSVGAALLGGTGCGLYADAKKTADQCLAIKRSVVFDKDANAAYAALAQKYDQAYEALHQLYQRLS